MVHFRIVGQKKKKSTWTFKGEKYTFHPPVFRGVVKFEEMYGQRSGVTFKCSIRGSSSSFNMITKEVFRLLKEARSTDGKGFEGLWTFDKRGQVVTLVPVVEKVHTQPDRAMEVEIEPEWEEVDEGEYDPKAVELLFGGDGV